METRAVNISEVVDNSKLGGFQIGIFLLCGACLIMDGFDVQAISFVAPAIVQQWKIPISQLGPVFSAALLGLFFGAVVFSQVADKIGRRPVLIGTSMFFSVMCFLTARSNSVGELMTLRFIGGIGMGAIMPNVTALVGEYSPKNSRVTMMMVVTNGFTIGAACAGFLSAWLIGAYGWRSVFYVGGLIPLSIAVLMNFWLPESLQFLVLKGKRQDQVGKWLKRIAPEARIDAATKFFILEENKRGVPTIELFREGRATGTILLWIIYVMNAVNLYFLSSWLPTVVRNAGYRTSTAALVGAALQVGGGIGAVALTWFVARYGPLAVLLVNFTIASLAVATIGQPALTLSILFVVVFTAGWCILGSQAVMNAFSATFYPTAVRSTGIGWGLGISRVGAVLGPLIAGIMLQRHWPVSEVFFAAAVPAIVSAVAAFALNRVIRTKATTASEAAVVMNTQ